MLARLRADYPRMAAIIVADSLYSKQPCVEQVTAKRFSFLLVAKPGDHKSLYQDLAVLRRACARNAVNMSGSPICRAAHQLHPLAHRQGRQDL